MEAANSRTIQALRIVVPLLAALFCTYLRISFLFLYPLIVVFIFYVFNWKLKTNALLIITAIGIVWLLSLRHGLYLSYNLLSLYYFLPFVVIAFASPQTDTFNCNFLRLFMNGLAVFAIVNDLVGIVQYIVTPNDDSFTGIYGSFTVSQNGLSIINGIIFFYYFLQYQESKKKYLLLLSAFFLVCCVLGFYGAGQLVLLVSVMLTFLQIRKKNFLQLIAVSVLTLGALVLVMKLVSPATYEYNVAILERFLNPEVAGMPRKLTAFKNYLAAYPSNFLDFVFGSGPGTFNSRSAFMIGSPTYFNVDIIKANDQPYYFANYAYPLWNATNTGPYDGFMNQPFSSLLALLGEYGVAFSVILFYLLVSAFFQYSNWGINRARERSLIAELRFYRFASIYAVLLIVIDNFIEYPEVMALLLLLIKLSEQRLKKGMTAA